MDFLGRLRYYYKLMWKQLRNNWCAQPLTYINRMFHIYTPGKRQKTFGFWRFQGVLIWNIALKWVNIIVNQTSYELLKSWLTLTIYVPNNYNVYLDASYLMIKRQPSKLSRSELSSTLPFKLSKMPLCCYIDGRNERANTC